MAGGAQASDAARGGVPVVVKVGAFALAILLAVYVATLWR